MFICAIKYNRTMMIRRKYFEKNIKKHSFNFSKVYEWRNFFLAGNYGRRK